MTVAKINGISLHYKVEGEGQPLVLVTGIGLTLSSLDSQAAAFKKHFKVVRLDNRGAGKSDKPFGPYSISEMAEDVIGLMDYLKIRKANILGYSMGGLIAQEIAINHPDRLEKLVLCATYSCIDNENGPNSELDKLKDLPKLKYLLGFLKLTTDGRIRPYIRLFQKILTSTKAASIGFEAQSLACQNHNARDRLCHIKAPTLIIVGTNDRLMQPRSSEVLAAGIADAKLVKIPNGSHLMPIERPKDFNREVLQFLGR